MNDLRISRRSELLEAEVGGELIALHVDSGTCFGFNPTASRIWALIEEPKTLSHLCELLGQEFEVDPETCARETVALVRELERDGLVEVSETSVSR